MKRGFALFFVLFPFAFGLRDLKPLPNVRQVFVVVCEGLTLQDMEQMGEPIPTLLRNGAIGLLSGSSAEIEGGQGVYATLGSGRRMKANEQAYLGKWLQQSKVSVSLLGNGILKAILGKDETFAAAGPDSPKVTFIAVSKRDLLKTIQKLSTQLPEGASLWLLVPNSPQTSWDKRRLTPILVYGKNVPAGLLTSPTTRKIGLVSSVDFAPTLLKQLALPIPAKVTGRTMEVDTSVKNRLTYLRWLDKRSVKPLQDLPAISLAVSFFIAAAISLTLFLSFLALRLNLPEMSWLFEVFRAIASFIIVSGMAIPVSLFVFTQLPNAGGMASSVQLMALVCFLGWLAFRLASKLDKFFDPHFTLPLRAAGLICAFSALVALLGVPLYWATPLGHYPTTGWRYFGITNSGIGIVLAGTVFAWKLLKLPRSLLKAWFAMAPFLMGLSVWGANFGGALTLAFGFAAAWEFVAREKALWLRMLALSLSAMLLTAIALLILESFVPFDQKAHLGMLLHQVKLVGATALWESVRWKMELACEFFARTPLNFFAFSLFVVFHFAVAYASRKSELFSKLKPAFNAVFVGSWAGLVLNDSGIEVVGMAMVGAGGVSFLALIETFRYSVGSDEFAFRESA
ncbi:MAG: hypothetical protein ACUVTP_13130 [Candidatus Fervidibacter sp.]|uniref:hypothetical protein n=1 Tax=Candidatus Fervidibacter sp. TaxID=3100871 RepID=UPI004049A122